jgi:phosphonate transport system permease protein
VTTQRGQRAAGLACVAVIALAVVASFRYLAVDFGGLFEAEARQRMARFVVEFFPPDVSPAFLRQVGFASLQTLAVSLLGTLIPMVVGGLLALPAAGRFGWPAKWLARAVLNGLRSVPELVWAALMVLAAGLGPFAGTLALGVHTGGVLGKLYADTFEEVSPLPLRGLRATGASPLQILVWGAWPEARRMLVGYTVLRWEMNLRTSTVLGLAGGGGIGVELYNSMQLGFYPRVATLIVIVDLMVIGTGWIGDVLRRRLSYAALSVRPRT